MRVCLVSLEFSPSVGGIQLQAEKQAHMLQELGHDVMIITQRLNKRWKSSEMLDGLPVVRVGGIYKRGGRLRIGRLGYLPTALATLIMLWRMRFQYDVIHVLDVSPLAAVAVIIGKITRKPVVITLPNTGPGKEQLIQLKRGATLMADTLPDADYLKIKAQDWETQAGDIAALSRLALGGQMIANLVMRSNAIFQCLSSRSRAYLIAHGIPSRQIATIPYGVDTERFHPSPKWQSKVETAERDIICVARLEYSKGIDVLLHAWTRIMRTDDEWSMHVKPRLLIVGDGAIRKQLERLANELCIENSVEFLGSRNDVLDLLQQSWGFVLPSRWEGLPNALLEAMACGLPCVAARVSGSEDVIKPGINGILVELEQPAELADALTCIMKDSNYAWRLGQEAHATIVREYQLRSVVRRYLELYQRLLGNFNESMHISLPPLSTTVEGGRGGE